MLMNLEWIADGVILLLCTMLFQFFRLTHTFKIMVVTFVCAWSGLAALHGWGLSLVCVTRFGLPNLTYEQVALVAYWLAFLVAALPSLVLMRAWLRSYSTTFPLPFDGFIRWGCTGLFVVGFACLMLMSAALAFPSVKEPENVVQWVSVNARRVPVQTYLTLTGTISSADAVTERLERLPKSVRDLFL